VFLKIPETDTCSPETIVSGNKKFSVEKCTGGYDEILRPQQSTLMKRPWWPMIERHEGLDEGKRYAFQTLRLSLEGVKEQA